MTNAFERTQQWASGTLAADWMDTFFTHRGWQISSTTRHEERDLCLGDRHFRNPDLHLLIEYKSGLQTAKTGNIFLETISVDTANKPGWVYTCKADFIFYAALLNGFILVMKPDHLRAEIDHLKAMYGERTTGKNQNKGYNTHGVIVPFEYAKINLTERIIKVTLTADERQAMMRPASRP